VDHHPDLMQLGRVWRAGREDVEHLQRRRGGDLDRLALVARHEPIEVGGGLEAGRVGPDDLAAGRPDIRVEAPQLGREGPVDLDLLGREGLAPLTEALIEVDLLLGTLIGAGGGSLAPRAYPELLAFRVWCEAKVKAEHPEINAASMSGEELRAKVDAVIAADIENAGRIY
jgi:hypothetical protein